LEHLSGIFYELDELLQDYLIKQADDLLAIQKKKIDLFNTPVGY
jgi:hypothetical protein